jgi:hypothetical protein
VTKSEMRVLWSAGLVNPGFPYRWLKPHLRPIARSLRDRGYIRRRNFKDAMKPTARGMALLTKS